MHGIENNNLDQQILITNSNNKEETKIILDAEIYVIILLSVKFTKHWGFKFTYKISKMGENLFFYI